MATPWTERELRTLAAIATTFVPGDDGARRARLVADALDRAADPSQVAQLRLVLRAFESRVANATLGGGATTFGAMSATERERLLHGWARSRIPGRRTAFVALRTLTTFLAYADPGPTDAPNPRLEAIGYRPDRPPLAARPTSVRPTPLPPGDGSPDQPIILEADAVVVGSGAGGGVVAAALAEAGRSVVVLEAGPFVDEASMPTDELDAFSRLYLNHGLLSTWDGAVTLLAGSAVGGGTLVNWLTSIAAPARVRDAWRTEHGIDDLGDGEAWTDDAAAIEAEIGVAPATSVPPKDEAILRGAAALGWEAARIRRNSAGCGDCGSCGFGCRRAAKQSGIRVHLARAGAAGARIVERVRVTRVLVDGGRAVGVEGHALVTDPQTGEPIPDPSGPCGARVRVLRVRAPQVVLAAGALRTPAVLQGSGLEHPAIGRYLRIHPVAGTLTRMATPVELWRGTTQAARSLEFLDGGAEHNGYLLESAPGHPGLIAMVVPWEGAAQHAAIMADARHLGAIIAITRDGGEGRTTLTRAGHVRLDYRLDGPGVATLRHGLVSSARLARAAGAIDIMAVGTRPAWFRGGTPGSGGRGDAAGAGGGVAGERAFARFLDELAAFDFSPNRGTVLSAHQMGTARMGAAPRDHVCDPGGRVRVGPRDDTVIGGLYVADGSLFPTGLGVNPMLTVMALARRVARTVLAEA